MIRTRATIFLIAASLLIVGIAHSQNPELSHDAGDGTQRLDKLSSRNQLASAIVDQGGATKAKINSTAAEIYGDGGPPWVVKIVLTSVLVALIRWGVQMVWNWVSSRKFQIDTLRRRRGRGAHTE